ncbi:MAG: hypothetical protein ACPL5I_16975 [Thermodesulfobacteriota bacterium]
MRHKDIAIIILSFYLVFSFSCAHQSAGKLVSHQASPTSQVEKVSWWQKEENQWLISALLILGIGIATSASIIIIYNSGGLFIKVKK